MTMCGSRQSFLWVGFNRCKMMGGHSQTVRAWQLLVFRAWSQLSALQFALWEEDQQNWDGTCFQLLSPRGNLTMNLCTWDGNSTPPDITKQKEGAGLLLFTLFTCIYILCTWIKLLPVWAAALHAHQSVGCKSLRRGGDRGGQERCGKGRGAPGEV